MEPLTSLAVGWRTEQEPQDVMAGGRTALDRIACIANDLARSNPEAHELVKELFCVSVDVVREQYLRPGPIDTAPKETSRKILLYCPKQGGWEAGEWSGERWISTRKIEFLDPTHWAEMPPEPEA